MYPVMKYKILQWFITVSNKIICGTLFKNILWQVPKYKMYNNNKI